MTAPAGTFEWGHLADGGVLVLARHGQTTLNADGRLRGHLDPELDDVGLAEVSALAMALCRVRPVRIRTSPLRRAVATGQAIAHNSGIAVQPDQRLIDRDYGEWAGEVRDVVVDRFGSVDAAPGVEAAADVLSRARAVVEEQAGIVADGGSVVLVAHDAVNRFLLADIAPELGEADAIGQRTACFNILTRSGDRWHVVAVDQKPDTAATARHD